MIKPDPKPRIRRIVVGLTSASDAERAVAAATAVARVVEAQLVGLCVQEQSMLDLADFPFARVLNFDSPKPREVSRQSMQRAFARTATICRRALLKHADKAQVNWSFSAERGEFNTVLQATAGTGDYVVLTGETHGIGLHAQLRDLRLVPARVGGVVVAGPHRKRRSAGPIVAIDDGDETGARTVAIAAHLAALNDKPLHLFAIAGSDSDVDRIRNRAEALMDRKQTVTTHRYLPGSPQSIAANLIHLSPFFVVGDLDGEPFNDDEIAVQLFRAARAPVLLLRKEPD